MTTIRLWFTKTGEAAYISLLDLQRVMQRAFKRSHLPVWYTLGFNPHIYMTFTAPLSLGQESLVESLDFKTEAEDFDWSTAAEILNRSLPCGIEAKRAEPAKTDPAEIAFAVCEARYAPQYAAKAQQAFADFALCETALVMKKGKKKTMKELDLKQYVEVTQTRTEPDGSFVAALTAPAGSSFTVNPMLVLTFLENRFGLPAACGLLLRTALLTKNKQLFV